MTAPVVQRSPIPVARLLALAALVVFVIGAAITFFVAAPTAKQLWGCLFVGLALTAASIA